jgi:hypothetical protein
MSAAFAVLVRIAGLFGVNLSGFAAGAIVAGLLAAGVTAYSGYLVRAGYTWAEGKCEAASVHEENARLTAALAEKERQLAFANSLQQRDAERAQAAENQLRQNQEAIDATPANPAKCFTRDMSRRLRDVR